MSWERFRGFIMDTELCSRSHLVCPDVKIGVMSVLSWRCKPRADKWLDCIHYELVAGIVSWDIEWRMSRRSLKFNVKK